MEIERKGYLMCSLKTTSGTAYSYRKNDGLERGSVLETRRHAVYGKI